MLKKIARITVKYELHESASWRISVANFHPDTVVPPYRGRQGQVVYPFISLSPLTHLPDDLLSVVGCAYLEVSSFFCLLVFKWINNP